MTGVIAGPPPNSVSNDGWAFATFRPGSPYITQVIAYVDSTQPPWRGIGYIAGEAPDGLVTFNGVGATRTLDLFDRETNTYLVSTMSAADGTYKFSGLSTSRTFDVRARGSTTSENDVIASQITPTALGMHAYWRVRVTANNGAVSASEIRRLQLRGSAGGADQAGGGTAISSGAFSTAYLPAFAFGPDNGVLADEKNSWASTNGSPVNVWLGYRFASPIPVAEVALIAPKSEPRTQMPRDFAIEFSDNGTTWTTARTYRGATGWSAGELRAYTV